MTTKYRRQRLGTVKFGGMLLIEWAAVIIVLSTALIRMVAS